MSDLTGRMAKCSYNNGRPLAKPWRNSGPIYGGGERAGLCDNKTGGGCRCLVSSDTPDLPFFSFRGEGSEDAKEICKVCNYRQKAHDPEHMASTVAKRTVVEQGKCTGFVPHGAFEYDSFFCGCAGWD